jgi:NAD(P)-dependent dehydrogenase (short-subunit alcohol dehydrogenase family)
MERDAVALKFIVNVSAMEGKFYRYKNETHPHTNMAKASLNMMTRTSAQDFVRSRIYMTAVDTGWINDEKPLDKAAQHFAKHKFQTPIDEQDAASRVLDPIIAPLLAVQRGEPIEPPWGVFLKDYMKCEW